jgi:hypothetical protein
MSTLSSTTLSFAAEEGLLISPKKGESFDVFRMLQSMLGTRRVDNSRGSRVPTSGSSGLDSEIGDIAEHSVKPGGI